MGKMDENSKRVLKKTIMGILMGSTAASLYSVFQARKYEPTEMPENDNDIINIPLSKKHFLKAVRKEVEDKDTQKKIENKKKVLSLENMSPYDLAAYKKELLRKSAACSSKKSESCGSTESPVSLAADIRCSKGNVNAKYRGRSGRFSSAKNLDKQAQISDSDERLYGNIGMVGGIATGALITKKLVDKILINRTQKRVSKSKRIYADMINKEVISDAEDDYEKVGEFNWSDIWGDIKTYNWLLSGAAAVVTYKIIENRRKAKEREADKDLSRFPNDKSINYSFV